MTAASPTTTQPAKSCENAVPLSPKAIVLAWLLENSFVVGVACLKGGVIGAAPRASLLLFMCVQIASGILTSDLAYWYHHWLATTVYADVPWFSEEGTKRVAPKSLLELVPKWLGTNFIVMVAGTLLEYFALTSEKPSFKPWDFPAKFAITRLTVDLVFYAAHRALHTPALYWIHKKHHEHVACHPVSTNLQFSLLDLFIEGFAPVFISLAALEAFGFQVADMDVHLLFGYMLYYETGTHAGKELPTVSYCPPLSLFTRLLGFERNNVRVHSDHHRLPGVKSANYGITTWVDQAMGTEVLLDPFKKE